MGYTHYWNPDRITLTADAIADVNTIIKTATTEGIHLAAGNGLGAPIADLNTGISLNGSQADNTDYESFNIAPTPLNDPQPLAGFTKTGRQPYDPVVCAILLLLSESNPNMGVRSDGCWDTEDEWVAGRDLFSRALHRDPHKPDSLHTESQRRTLNEAYNAVYDLLDTAQVPRSSKYGRKLLDAGAARARAFVEHGYRPRARLFGAYKGSDMLLREVYSVVARVCLQGEGMTGLEISEKYPHDVAATRG